LEKTLFHYFSERVCVAAKKMKVCFVRLAKKKNKKCAVAKNKTSLCWLIGLAVSRSVMISYNVRFMSVSLMLALSP
jgi:hypothetical protein